MTAAEVLRVAPEALAEEIAAARGQYGRAIAHLATAVRLEDALAYTEPEEWPYPTRLALGAVLIAAGRAPEAEAVYWRHLAIHRDNGWALFGLRQALEAQGKVDEARTVKARFDRAWARADVTLTASRFAHRAPTR
jgi:tetratricopeptide (TPR) repeat protein